MRLEKAESDKVDAIKDWMREQGGELTDVDTLFDESGNMRVVTTTRVSQGQQILRLPVEATLYDTMSYPDPDISKLRGKLDGSALMAFMLVNERRNDHSKYKALLRTLPTKLTKYAIYYNAQELALLTGSALLSNSKGLQRGR